MRACLHLFDAVSPEVGSARGRTPGAPPSSAFCEHYAADLRDNRNAYHQPKGRKGWVCAGETGGRQMVKVHCDEGLTNHIGPESCAAVREDVREALTGVRAGQATERRNFALREAHALLTAEGNMATIRFGKDRAVPRRQRPWHVRKSFAREPGDLHNRPGAPGSGPRREGVSRSRR
jgi:hypothetical protein